MIVVDCNTCRDRRRCPERIREARYRESAFAWAHGRLLPTCRDYAQNYYHGVDGVLAHPSPRPSRRRGITSINHGDRTC